MPFGMLASTQSTLTEKSSDEILNKTAPRLLWNRSPREDHLCLHPGPGRPDRHPQKHQTQLLPPPWGKGRIGVFFQVRAESFSASDVARQRQRVSRQWSFLPLITQRHYRS